MGTTALSVLDQRLGEQTNDYLQVATTTDITTSAVVVSTNLRQYDGGRDGYFDDWWVQILGTNNDNVQRLTGSTTYATATGTLTVYGANLAAESAAVNIRLHRHDPAKKLDAINDAIRECSASLREPLLIDELVTGNVLPNSHFRNWAVSTVPDKWGVTNATAAADTTAGEFRGGNKSAKVSATSADGYMDVDSNDYPRLLDLMGQTCSFFVWAYPQTANDAFITVYTVQADGTAQTLSSTTTCPASKWTLLQLEDQSLNDDLVQIQVRLRVHTSGQYVIFDHARGNGRSLREFLLPTDFSDDNVTYVYIQTSGYSDEICDDLNNPYWSDPVVGFHILRDGTDKFLQLPAFYSKDRLIRLVGDKPLSTVSSWTDTVNLDAEQINLLIACAKYKLYQILGATVSYQDVSRYESLQAQAYAEYLRLLPRLSKTASTGTMKLHLPGGRY